MNLEQMSGKYLQVKQLFQLKKIKIKICVEKIVRRISGTDTTNILFISAPALTARGKQVKVIVKWMLKTINNRMNLPHILVINGQNSVLPTP